MRVLVFLRVLVWQVQGLPGGVGPLEAPCGALWSPGLCSLVRSGAPNQAGRWHQDVRVLREPEWYLV